MVIASFLRKYGLKNFWKFYGKVEFLSLGLDGKNQKSKIVAKINESLSKHIKEYN
jgi:hypothetical protein